MPADYIALNPAAAGQKLVGEWLAAQRDIARGEERIRKIVETLDHNVDDPNYSGVQTMLGTTSNGQTLYNLAVGSLTALNNSDLQAFLHRTG